MRFAYRERTSARAEARGSLAAGFTIVELVVSIGILGILMVVAGGVFALTLKSSGQATAVIEVHQALRALEDSLREDLRFVQPGASIMVIQSHAINGYWTDQTQELDLSGNPLDPNIAIRDPQRERVIEDTSGNEIQQRQPPRADMLMFFTTRPGTSFRDPDVSSRLQQVVYGHALPGELNPATGAWSPTLQSTLPAGVPDHFAASSFPLDQLQKSGPNDYTYSVIPANAGTPPPIFPISARNFHLARRSVLIVDEDLSGAMPAKYPAAWLDDGAAMVSGIEDDPDYPTLQKSFYVRDGRRDYLVNGNNPDAPEFVYAFDVVNRLKPDPVPGIYVEGDGAGRGPAFDVDYANVDSLVNWMQRTRLDVTPPTSQSRRIGQYFMPGCASFKVEWALDVSDVVDMFDAPDMNRNFVCTAFKRDFLWNKEVLWIDPLKFAETIQRIRDHRANDFFDPSGTCDFDAIFANLLGKLIFPNPSDYVNRPNPDRFAKLSGSDVIPFDTHVFYSNNPFSPNTPPSVLKLDEPDPLFPKALRITVDVFDSAGRLERPIRHVMILPVGQ